MQGRMYALVGNFGFGPEPKGISVFSYDRATARCSPWRRISKRPTSGTCQWTPSATSSMRWTNVRVLRVRQAAVDI